MSNLQSGTAVDLHSLLPNIPLMLPGHRYAGPNNPLDKQIQTDKLVHDPGTGTVDRKSIVINPGNEPTSPLDEIALRHDTEYNYASTRGDQELNLKHMADKRMVDDIDNLQSRSNQPGLMGVYQNVMAGLTRGVIDAKYKLGLGVDMRQIYKQIRYSKKYTKKALENELIKKGLIVHK